MLLLLVIALLGKSALAKGDYGATSGGGDLLNQVAFVSALGLSVAGLQPWKSPGRLLVLPLGLVLALAWAWLSVSWSLAPSISVRRIALLTIATLTAFLTVRQLGVDRSIALIRVTLIAALVGSLMAGLFLPSVGIQHMVVLTEKNAGGTWRGLFIDKNMCGQFCMIITLFFVYGRFPERQRSQHWQTVLRVMVVLLAIVLLYKTQSKTSMGVLALALAFGFFAQYVRRLRYLLIPLAAYMAVLVIFFSHTIAAPFLNALDDPEAFTGRGAIWAALVVYLQDHWLLGAGYGTFWAVGDLSPIYETARQAWVTQVLTGHNGYLDVWVQIGLPGLILVVAATLVVPLAKAFWVRIEPKDTALLSSLIVGIAGISLTESVLFNTDMMTTILHMIIIALIGETVAESRGRTHSS